MPDELILEHLAEHGVGTLAELREELESAEMIDCGEPQEVDEAADLEEWERRFPGTPMPPVGDQWRRASS